MTRRLPAPLSGMAAARRPSGVIFGTVVPIVAVFSGLIVSGMVYVALTGSSTMPPWMTVVAFGSVLLVVYAWVRLKERRPFATIGFVVDGNLARHALRGAGVGVGLATAAMLILALCGQAEIRWGGGELSAGDWFLAAAWIGIFAVQASAEEAAVRGLAMQAYARRLGVAAAIILQAVLFALLHGQNDGMGALPVVNLLLVGIALGCWAVADGSLWGVCAFHGAWNWSLSWLFGSVVSGQGGDDRGIFSVALSAEGSEALTGGAFGVEGSVVVTALLAALIAVLLPRVRRAVLAARNSSR